MSKIAPNQSLPAAYFDEVYSESPDPWGFATREYEQNKYQDTLAHLPRAQYTRTLEIGCSIGVLTAQLSSRTEELLAIDISELPLQSARARCAELSGVSFQRMAFPHEVPSTSFDLIMVSEVAYYWGGTDLSLAQQQLLQLLRPGGDLMLVHWLPFVTDYPYTGDEVHDSFTTFAAAHALDHIGSKREPLYRMDIFRRSGVVT